MNLSSNGNYIYLILFSAKAIDEYASLKSKAAESSDESIKVDPRLEAIVERLLDKYVSHNHSSDFCIQMYLNSNFPYFLLLFPDLGVSWMENTNKLWELLPNAGD